MICGCPLCGALTTHMEKGLESYCKCQQCGWECRDCMGGENKKFRHITKDMLEDIKDLSPEDVLGSEGET